MKTKLVSCLLVAAALLWALPVLAQSGIPDLSHCEAWSAYEGEETPTLLVAPDGSGRSFDQAQLPDGQFVDATVYLRVLDWNDDPIYMFPAEDMWLVSIDGGMVPCVAGNISDVNTDATGLTYWVEPLLAGGYSEMVTLVMVNGDSVWDDGIMLSYNSPDMNGDGSFNLADMGMFSTDFYGEYHFRSDFFRDGAINLSDVGQLATSFGANCP